MADMWPPACLVHDRRRLFNDADAQWTLAAALVGGFPDGVGVEQGYLTMPDLPGIGFEGKSDLYRVPPSNCRLKPRHPKKT